MTAARAGQLYAAGIFASLFMAASLAGAPTPAAAAPTCTFAEPLRSVAKRFKRVVRAKPSIRTSSRTHERWEGQIILTDLRFIKWPKGEALPTSLTIDFEFIREESCPYYPDLFHKYFVLDKVEGRYAIVNSSERRGR